MVSKLNINIKLKMALSTFFSYSISIYISSFKFTRLFRILSGIVTLSLGMSISVTETAEEAELTFPFFKEVLVTVKKYVL